MHDLIARSQEIISAAQAPSGAYPACPEYPTYRYSWFRDGTFIAHAMARHGARRSADRFYEWAARLVLARAASIERCVAVTARGGQPDPADLLHTRYTLDGRPGSDEWPNYQLDGFGTLLWGLIGHLGVVPSAIGGEHGTPATQTSTPQSEGVSPLAASTVPAGEHLPPTGQRAQPDWRRAICLLVRYTAALWQRPNSDCWEEFADRIAISTLAALHAGLHAASGALGVDDADGRLAAATASQLRAMALERGTHAGHLIKQIDGEDVVDASLLWACVPFGEHGLLAADDSLMRATAERIVTDLTGATGGIHRYRADTFYGGGEWILLTALLGEYHVATGDRKRALQCRAFVERHADPDGRLPEQSSEAPLAPSYVAEWVSRWGPVAKPLLWSHAGYLSLCAALDATS